MLFALVKVKIQAPDSEHGLRALEEVHTLPPFKMHVKRNPDLLQCMLGSLGSRIRIRYLSQV